MSELSWSWEQTNRFVQTMLNARILLPHSTISSYLSGHQHRIDVIHWNSKSIAPEHSHRDIAEDVQCYIIEMCVILKYTTYLALDACAVLGGTEMPVWLLHPEATGVFFDEPEISPEDVTFTMTL